MQRLRDYSAFLAINCTNRYCRELFIKIVLGIRTENKNGAKYPWRDGAEKCSCTGTMLNIGLVLVTGACILGCSLEPLVEDT